MYYYLFICLMMFMGLTQKKIVRKHFTMINCITNSMSFRARRKKRQKYLMGNEYKLFLNMNRMEWNPKKSK